MRIDARTDPEEAARYKLVRADTYQDIAGGEIVWADEATGNYALRAYGTGTVIEHTLASNLLRIALR